MLNNYNTVQAEKRRRINYPKSKCKPGLTTLKVGKCAKNDLLVNSKGSLKILKNFEPNLDTVVGRGGGDIS